MSFFNRIVDRMSTAGAAKRRLPVRRIDRAELTGTASVCAEQVLRRYTANTVDEMLENFTDPEIDFTGLYPPYPHRLDLGELIESATLEPARKLVYLVFLLAIRDKASDIHFEPFENEYRMRYRADGRLLEMTPPPRHLADEIAEHIKSLAKLDVAPAPLPRDGRIELVLGANPVNLLVFTLPTLSGESIVVRICDPATLLPLDALGMSPAQLTELRQLIQRRNGLLLSTGGGGAGKTTTQYAALQELNQSDRKLITVEDPVEYPVSGLTQVAINEANGLDYPKAIQAARHQNPDVLFVNEIRDLEIAQAVVQAALMSQLVLSSVHTPDAVSAITRLVDMSVPRRLVASSVSGVVAQRLVRKICSDCRTEFQPSAELLAELRLRPELLAGRKFYRGVGCGACAQTGYNGRSGLFELVVVDDDFRDLVFTGASTNQLRRHVRKKGVLSLRQAGLAAVFAGITTLDEIVRATDPDDDC
jgi:type IV pilus assembly protein PilB